MVSFLFDEFVFLFEYFCLHKDKSPLQNDNLNDIHIEDSLISERACV